MLKVKAISSSSVVKFASEELKKYSKNIPAEGKEFILGAYDNFPNLKSFFDGKKKDSILLFPEGNRLILTGNNERSVLFSVYEYLEEFLGIKWFAPGEEYVPFLRSIPFPDKPYFHEASLKYRGHLIDTASISWNRENISSYIDWLVKNRANYLLFSVYFWDEMKEVALPEIKKRGMILELGHHGFDYFVPIEKYSHSHPEWFSLVDGERGKGWKHGKLIGKIQLCVSNEEAVNTYLHNFLQFMEENPYAQIYGVIPNDGCGWCECEKCQKIEKPMLKNPLFNESKTGTRRYLYLVKKVAEKVKKESPDKKISFWAYACTIVPPPEGIDLPDNTLLSSFATYNRCYQHHLFDPRCNNSSSHLNTIHADLLEKWKELYSGEIIVYEYYTKYLWLSLPKFIPHLINKETRELVRREYNGLITFAEESNWLTYETNLLSHLVTAWDSEVDIDDYFHKYFSLRYREAGEEMERYHREMESLFLPLSHPQWEFPKALTCKISKELKKEREILNNAKMKSSSSLISSIILNLKYSELIFKWAKKIYEARDNFKEKEKEESIKNLNEALFLLDEIVEYTRKNKDCGTLLDSNFLTLVHKRRKEKIEKLKSKVISSSASEKDFNVW